MSAAVCDMPLKVLCRRRGRPQICPVNHRVLSQSLRRSADRYWPRGVLTSWPPSVRSLFDNYLQAQVQAESRSAGVKIRPAAGRSIFGLITAPKCAHQIQNSLAAGRRDRVFPGFSRVHGELRGSQGAIIVFKNRFRSGRSKNRKRFVDDPNYPFSVWAADSAPPELQLVAALSGDDRRGASDAVAAIGDFDAPAPTR